jgi:hypothetical protein
VSWVWVWLGGGGGGEDDDDDDGGGVVVKGERGRFVASPQSASAGRLPTHTLASSLTRTFSRTLAPTHFLCSFPLDLEGTLLSTGIRSNDIHELCY